MKTYRIFYRVPATESHKGFLSETLIEAASEADACRKFHADHPSYPITSVFDGI